jgi:hypothetical protein
MIANRAVFGLMAVLATGAHAQVVDAPAVSPAFLSSPAYLTALVTQHQNIRRQINTAKLRSPINLDEIRLLEQDLVAVEERIASIQPEPLTTQPASAQDLSEKHWDIFGDFDPAKKPATTPDTPPPATQTTTKE